MYVLLLALYSFVFLTGDFTTDVKRLQNCNTLAQIIIEYRNSDQKITPYQKKLKDTLTPWYRKNCSA